jgi:hypothetical protein
LKKRFLRNNMVILKTGINEIVSELSSSLAEGDWGTGTAAELSTDAGLETEVVGVEQATISSTADATVQVTAVLPSTEGNGNAIAEHVVRFQTGTNFTRTTFSPISKDSNKEIHTISTVVVTTPAQ